MKTQIDVNWLHVHLKDPSVHVLDASWALDGRDMRISFAESHIEGAQFFDIEAISDKDSLLPHMAPSADIFAQAVGAMGINEQDTVIVYDQFGLFSAARVWWTFQLMGHRQIYVLRGGLPAWIDAGFKISSHTHLNKKVNYTASFNKKLIIEIRELRAISNEINVVILDARPEERFLGKAREPRAGLRNGHMPHSLSLPYSRLIENGTLLDKARLISIFNAFGIDQNSQIITTCGSGITAAILSMALEECGFSNHRLYDGSWAQWGRSDSDTIVLSGG